MSVSGISSSTLFDFNTQAAQNKRQQFQQEFQQLGQDLQSGNLSAAQSDFAALEQLKPQTSSTASSSSNSPIAQASKQLSQDLQSGNVSAAQQDFATIQQDVQTKAAQGHHHHHGGGGSGPSAISQLLDQVGQALQSGNLSSAQQAYTALQQDFQQFAPTSGLLTASTQSSSTGFSTNA